MSQLRSFVRNVEARARQAGIQLSMSKLRDAITVALCDRTYAASIAAESAGTLEPIVLPPPHLARAAERYRIDASAFGFAFPAGVGDDDSGHAEADDGLSLDVAPEDFDTLAPLYHRYPGQDRPQDAHVWLDENGIVGTGYNPEIGDALPSEVWHGRVLRFPVDPCVSGQSLVEYLLGPGRSLLARIHAGHTVTWDGKNKKGRFDDDALAAREQFIEDLAELPTDNVMDVEQYLFGGCRLNDYWRGQTFDEAVVAAELEAKQQGVRIYGEVRDALISRAKHTLERSPETLARDVVRSLAQLGEVSLLDYAQWIAEYDDGADERESAKDAALEMHLWITDSGASTAEIESGVKAAHATFEALGVRPAQAYVAAMLAANDASHVAAHREAWENAELAACRACFDGWATWPESAVLTTA